MSDVFMQLHSHSPQTNHLALLKTSLSKKVVNQPLNTGIEINYSLQNIPPPLTNHQKLTTPVRHLFQDYQKCIALCILSYYKIR